MNIGAARIMDYWLGIPLCLFLSGFNRIIEALSFKDKKAGEPKKILFIKLSELGAVILSYPLLKRVKEDHPSAELFFATFHRNKDVFKLLGGIIEEKNVLIIREGPLSFVSDTLRAIKRLRKEKLDIVFDLEFFSRFSMIFAYLARAAKRTGFHHYTFEGLYRGRLLTHEILYNPAIHITKAYLSMGRIVKESQKRTPELRERIDDGEINLPEYRSDKETKERLLRKLRDSGIDPEGKKTFLINAGEGALALREWPIDNFITLTRLILEDKDAYVLAIGTEGANIKAREIIKVVNSPRCKNLVNLTGLAELLELFLVSDALVSNDCGLAHLAALTPVKAFVIFGPQSPRAFGPLADNNRILYSDWPCSPCLFVLNHISSKCRDNECVKAIKAEEVFNLITKSLQRERAVGL